MKNPAGRDSSRRSWPVPRVGQLARSDYCLAVRSLLLILAVSLAILGTCVLRQPEVGGPANDVGETVTTSAASEPDAAASSTPDMRAPIQRQNVQPTTALRVRVAGYNDNAKPFSVAAWRQNNDGKWSKHAVGASDESGAAVVAITAGRYRISFDAPKVVRAPLPQWYDVREGEVRDLTVRLPKPCPVTGRILNAAGEPLPGVAVTLSQWAASVPDTGFSWCRTKSDLSGRFRLPLLAPGHSSLLLKHPAHALRTCGTGECIAGHTTDLGDLKLSRGLQLRGRVVDVDGKPLVDATVMLTASKRVITTDAVGRFALDRVVDGATLLVTCDGYVEESVTVGDTPSFYGYQQPAWSDPSKPLDLKLVRGLRIVGKIACDHLPVKVIVHTCSDRITWQTEPAVDGYGKFRTKGLRGGRTKIQAYAPGFGYSEMLEIDLKEDGQEVALTVHPTMSLAVKVVDERKVPVAGAAVTIKGYTDHRTFPCVFGERDNVTTKPTDAHGVVVFDGVHNGTWKIKVAASGHLTGEAKVALMPETAEQVVSVQRAARLEVSVRDAPPELAEDLRVYCRSTSGGGDQQQFRLHDAAAGIDLLAGTYEVTCGPKRRAKAMLGTRAALVPAQTVAAVAGETQHCELVYHAMPRVKGRLLLPAFVEGPVKVYAMRPDAWPKRRENAHFLGFSLDVYATRADCEPDGSFEFHLAEHGSWLFVAKFATSPVPVQLGVLDLDGEATPTFRVPGVMVRGSLHPDFRRADGRWPRLLLVPSFLSSHDPFYQVGGHDLYSLPSRTPSQRFGQQPRPNGSFLIGPLESDVWTLTVRDERQVLLARDLQVGAAPIDLGEVPVPGAGPLTVLVGNAGDDQAAVLRQVGKDPADKSAYLMFAKCKDGAFRFGKVPFGNYRLQLMYSMLSVSFPAGQTVALQHTKDGVEPSSITFPDKK